MSERLWLLAGFFLALMLMAALAFWWAWRQRLRSGLPAGRVIYADTSTWRRCEKPLYAPRYRLTGRPDYLVEEGGHRIPVEVKPGRAAREPFPSDVFQLAAYCLLVEETFGRPPYGLIRYRDDTFRIAYTERMRAQLLALLGEIRRQKEARDVRPNHDDPQRCLRCGYRHVCRQSLA